MKSSWSAFFFCPQNLHILTMVTSIRVNTPALPVWGIPPTLSIQILCFAMLSPRVREWPLHLSSYPRQKPDSLRCLNIGRFISLISALTPASLHADENEENVNSYCPPSPFFLPLFPPSPSSLIPMFMCLHVHPFSSPGYQMITVVWTASVLVLRLCPILWRPNSLGSRWAFLQCKSWWWWWWLKGCPPLFQSASSCSCWNVPLCSPARVHSQCYRLTRGQTRKSMATVLVT